MAGSTLRSGGPAACTDVSIRDALEQATMSSRPSCPRRSSSAAPTAAGASRMPEVRRSTWLTGLAIPNFTLAHPKNAEVLCASTLAAVVLPRPDSTSYKDSYVEKLSRRLFSGACLQFQGCSGLVLVGAGLVICIRGRTSFGPCQGLAPRADSRSSAIRWSASRFRTSRSGLSSLAIDKRVRRLQAVAVAQSAVGRRGRKFAWCGRFGNFRKAYPARLEIVDWCTAIARAGRASLRDCILALPCRDRCGHLAACGVTALAHRMGPMR